MSRGGLWPEPREDRETCCRLRLSLRFCPSHGTHLRAPLRHAGFLVNLAFPHLLLESRTLHYLAETSHRLLDRLPIPQEYFDHCAPIQVDKNVNTVSRLYLILGETKGTTAVLAADTAGMSRKVGVPEKVPIPYAGVSHPTAGFHRGTLVASAGPRDSRWIRSNRWSGLMARRVPRREDCPSA